MEGLGLFCLFQGFRTVGLRLRGFDAVGPRARGFGLRSGCCLFLKCLVEPRSSYKWLGNFDGFRLRDFRLTLTPNNLPF